MTRNEYENILRNIRNEIIEKQNEMKAIQKKYGLEVLERDGFHLGQVVEYNGQNYAIVGVDTWVGKCVIVGTKIKKDGSPSLSTSTLYNFKLSE